MKYISYFFKIIFVVISLFGIHRHLFQTRVGDSSTCNFEELKALRVVPVNDLLYNRSRFFGQYAARSGDPYMLLNPEAIVYCKSESQVIKTIKFAERCGYTVAVRSGGHSYTGESSCSSPKCIQIDVSRINHLEFFNSTIVAGPGVLLRNLISKSIFHGVVIPHGVCKNVGLGGHLQSSAAGLLGSAYGSGMDHVQEFRIVLPNATVVTASIRDSDQRLYRSVLGGGPGSWGVVTQYTLNGIKDNELPYSRLIIKKYKFTPEVAFKVWKHVMNIHEDQENTNKRDVGMIFNIGHSPSLIDFLPDIPLLGPVSGFVDVEKDNEVYVYVIMMWSGIDSGKLSDTIHNKYIYPFETMEQPLILSINLPLPLSIITSTAATFENKDHRYHIASVHTDNVLSDNFLRIMINELDQRRKVEDSMFLLQYVSIGTHSQWYKNKNLNSLSWRDTKSLIDDWFIFKNASRGDMIGERMRKFYQSTKKYWVYSDGSERRTWMTPQTIYHDSTNLSNPLIAKMYYPNQTQFKELCSFKSEIDKKHLFANKGTVPLC